MIKTWKDVAVGDKLWACEYGYYYNRTEKALIQPPVYGQIVKGRYNIRSFAILKKDGMPRTSGLVDARSRHYADTKEECIKLYNSLIQKRVEFLQNQIDEIKKDLLPEL